MAVPRLGLWTLLPGHDAGVGRPIVDGFAGGVGKGRRTRVPEIAWYRAAISTAIL